MSEELSNFLRARINEMLDRILDAPASSPPTSPTLDLGAGQHKLVVSMESFFAFNFELTEVLDDLVASRRQANPKQLVDPLPHPPVSGSLDHTISECSDIDRQLAGSNQVDEFRPQVPGRKTFPEDVDIWETLLFSEDVDDESLSEEQLLEFFQQHWSPVAEAAAENDPPHDPELAASPSTPIDPSPINRRGPRRAK